MTNSNGSTRPEPLRQIAGLAGPAIGLAVAAVNVATTLGGLSSKTGGMLNRGLKMADVALAVVPAIIAGAGAAGAAKVVAEQGRRLVSPIESAW